jgi:hypothetical protein
VNGRVSEKEWRALSFSSKPLKNEEPGEATDHYDV